VKPWPDHPTRLSNPECRGVAFSRNRAFGVAKTDWIKLRDADEVLAPFALERVRPAEPPVPARLHVPAGGCHRIVDGLPTRDCLHQPYYATPFPENGDRGRVSDVSTPESKK
jgi:glycosyltransferase involved in cell wall biosynthesis